jgi:cell filamentation protein
VRDPYLYDDVPVLRNLKNIKDSEDLKTAEGDITKHTMAMVYTQKFTKFNTEALSKVHWIIFSDLYEWAGEFRTILVTKSEPVLGGDTVRYTYPKQIKKELDETVKEIAKLKKSEDKKDLVFKLVRIAGKLWQTHPFRDGNTRAVISFIVLLAEHLGISMNYVLFEKHAAYVRNALVWSAQGIYPRFEYLENIFYDAAGVKDPGTINGQEATKDYTMIGDYSVVNYKEVPHVYVEE